MNRFQFIIRLRHVLYLQQKYSLSSGSWLFLGVKINIYCRINADDDTDPSPVARKEFVSEQSKRHAFSSFSCHGQTNLVKGIEKLTIILVSIDAIKLFQ